MTGDRELVLVNVNGNRVRNQNSMYSKRIGRLIRASAPGQNAKINATYAAVVLRVYTERTRLCAYFKRKYNFWLCYRVDAKKIKVLNAQINLPKLHTKYQSIHTLSKNSHVHDR